MTLSIRGIIKGSYRQGVGERISGSFIKALY